MMRVIRFCLALSVLLAAGAASFAAQGQPRLMKWERGVALTAPEQPGMTMYLWFYEWNMFGAVAPGQHTQGSYQFATKVNPDRTEAVIDAGWMRLRVRAAPGGADLYLTITNTTDYDWPELAGIIPCWNPGRTRDAKLLAPGAFYHEPSNSQFADPERNRTFFLSPDGLVPLASRDIHFNGELKDLVNRAAGASGFVFSKKWPTSKVDASAGLIIRESADRKWVTGIGWQSYLSVQAHNPWNCMHAGIRVGPLKRHQSKTIQGKLYLFQGDRDACLKRFLQDFQAGK